MDLKNLKELVIKTIFYPEKFQISADKDACTLEP